LPWACISGISSRAHKGERDEHGRQHDAGHSKDHPDVVLDQPRPPPALSAEQQDKDQPRDHRGHRKGEVDHRGQQRLPREFKFGDRPGGTDAEDDIGRDRNGGGHDGQSDGRPRVRFGQRGEIQSEPLAQRFDEDGGERHHEEQPDKTEGNRQERELEPARIIETAAARSRANVGESGDGASHEPEERVED
jgi:hypothetical protein